MCTTTANHYAAEIYKPKRSSARGWDVYGDGQNLWTDPDTTRKRDDRPNRNTHTNCVLGGGGRCVAFCFDLQVASSTANECDGLDCGAMMMLVGFGWRGGEIGRYCSGRIEIECSANAPGSNGKIPKW